MARRLKPATQWQRNSLEIARDHLDAVIKHLRDADCPKTLDRAIATRRSLGGAARHMERRTGGES